MNIARSGALYLSSIVKKNGLFRYKISPITNETLKGYNTLRHCGTIWSMLDVYKHNKSQKILDAAELAINKMYNKYIKAYHGFEKFCVISEKKNMIKSGGIGLAILALCEYYEIKKDSFALEICKKLGSFALSLFKENGDMIHRLYYDTGKEFLGNEKLEKRCEYYPGEVLFGLIRLYEVTKDQKWINFVLLNEFHLDGKYGVSEKNHWMLYTLKHLYRYKKQKKIYDHAKKIATSILHDCKRKMRIGNACGLATYTEGLLCFIDMKHSSEIMRQIEQNLRFQLKYRDPSGFFLLNEKSRVIRIDAIQHNISSFLHYGKTQKY